MISVGIPNFNEKLKIFYWVNLRETLTLHRDTRGKSIIRQNNFYRMNITRFFKLFIKVHLYLMIFEFFSSLLDKHMKMILIYFRFLNQVFEIVFIKKHSNTRYF